MAVSFDLSSVVTRRKLLILGSIFVVELLLLATYLLVTPAAVTRLRYTLYPFVWINVGIWALLRTRSPRAPINRRLAAGGIAVLYLFVLLWLAGLVGFAPTVPAEDFLGVSVGFGTPGWERVRLVTRAFYLTLLPFRVIGYLALAYLVYVTILDAASAVIAGAIGFVSCLSCSFSVLVSLTAGVLGSSVAVAGPLLAYSLDISTAVYLLAVFALYYRPGFQRAGGLRQRSTQSIE